MWPFQRQPINLQRQIAGPAPGQGMPPSKRGQKTRNGVMTPFAHNDPFNGPGRDSERIMQAQSATPLNAYLAQKFDDGGGIRHYRYAHRIRTPLTRYYPRSPWWPDRRAMFLAPDAYTSLRPYQKGFAPPANVRTAGGLEVSQYQVQVGNINTQLAKMYLGASAPVSANQSGVCK